MEASFTILEVDSDNHHIMLLSPTPSFFLVTYFGTVDERRGVADVLVGDGIWLNKFEIMLQIFWSFLVHLWRKALVR